MDDRLSKESSSYNLLEFESFSQDNREIVLLKTRKMINPLPHNPTQLLTTRKKKALENTVGKGENAGNHHFHQHFLRFPLCFLP